ncbi:MAG TPA: response regulator transcription factor [Actinomycetota bacterium]|nr:response regulator transcription factor [Actinomycetota bacterium]
MTADSQIRVLIADDDPGTRATLIQLLAREQDLKLVGVAGDADQAVALARDHAPDVALLDVRMPGGGGTRAAAGIALASPRTVMIAFSMREDASSVADMFERGVGSYVSKDAPLAALVEAIRAATRGPTASTAGGERP